MSTHYFPISLVQGSDLQRWVAATDTLGGICCNHTAASSWANQRKSRSDDHRLDGKNKQICAILDRLWNKKSSFLFAQTNWVCSSEAQSFKKMTLTRVIQCDTSRVILWKSWLKSSHYFSQRDSSRVRVTKNCNSSRVTESSHAITDRFICCCHLNKILMNFFISDLNQISFKFMLFLLSVVYHRHNETRATTAPLSFHSLASTDAAKVTQTTSKTLQTTSFQWCARIIFVESESPKILSSRVTIMVESLWVIGLQTRVNVESYKISNFSYIFLAIGPPVDLQWL